MKHLEHHPTIIPAKAKNMFDTLIKRMTMTHCHA